MKDRILKISIMILIINLFWNIPYVDATTKDNINFNNITIEDGLTQGSVETLFQDSLGYIWIGTNDGLNRYNGHELKVYRQEPDNKNSLVNNYILDIKEDKYKNIWVATANGLSKIHNDKKTITNYLDEPYNGNLSDSNIATILITKDNNILVGTSNGLNLYDEKSDSFTRILDDERLTEQYINSLEEDGDGNIWVATEAGLNKIDRNSGQVQQYLANGTDNSLLDNYIYKVYYDREGYIWVGTYNEGASRINIKTDEITNYKNDCRDNKSLPGNYIRNFLRDSEGQMWIATDYGLARYNEEENNFINYVNKIYDNHTLVNDDVFSIIQDKSGLIWVGTYAGISIFNPKNKIRHYKNDPFNPDTISDNMVLSLYEDNEGLIWIGTSSKGINLLNPETDDLKFIEYNKDDIGISGNTIYDINGHGDLVFLSTSSGIDIIDKSKKTIKNYSQDDGLPSKYVRCTYYDSKGYLWIGTTSGLAVMNIETEEIIDLEYIFEKYSLNDKYIGDIFEDSKGNYWIGTFVKGGLIKLNPNNKNVQVYKYDENNSNSISNDAIRDISEDDKGQIWIGTNLGLNKFVEKEEKFIRYSTKDGLSNNTIYGILIDDSSNIWVSTNMGISKLDVKNNIFINYNLADGLQSNEFNGKAYFKTKKGDLLFGGINGLNIFDPDEMYTNTDTYELTFDEFKLNGIIVENIDGEEFKRNENNIFIEVFLPNYLYENNIQYYYFLEGASDEWMPMEKNSITLSNLAAGDYKFRVKARSSNGIMSEEKSVEFRIKPYFWLSKESFLIYILIGLVFLYQSRLKMKKLDRLVRERTEKLSLEMEKNQALFNKLIKLERTKNNYFVNMSHELRTPLNVIYSTEQLIRELNNNNNGIDKDRLNYYMKMIGNNTKRLLKIINDLIDTSKIEHGNYKINLEETDIVYVVEEAALSLKNYIESKGLTLIIDPEIEEKIIIADGYEIERCIINLVSNAAKFTKEGGFIKVNIKDLNDKVQIEIEDNGIGIDKGFHKVIFNRFNQIIDKNSETKGGSGLGLTITKQIVDLHNGEIYLESKVGVGTKFTIILPVNH